MARCRFGDVVKEIKNSIDRDNNPYDYYIAGGHMDSEDLHIHRRGSFKTDDVGPAFIREFQKGQVLYGSRRTYLKKVAVADFDGVTANTTFVLETKDENVLLQSLLPFVMLSDSFTEWSIGKSKGSTNPYVLFSDLADYEFELPPIEKQRTLAKLLWEIDSTKCSYKDLIDKTDEVVKSQFIEMFGDPITNDRGWEYKKLPEVTEIVLGSTPSTKNPEYWDGELKWITPAELTDTSFYVYDTEKHITERGAKDAGLKICPAETVLFSTRAPIGKTAIAGVDMYCNQGFKNFVCGPMIRPVFLYYLLTLKKDYFEGLGTGTTFKELSRGMLEKVSISVPPVEEQMQFENLYRQSDKSKFELNESIKELDAMYKRIIKDNLG
ncbi:MAG: restriction endonuclease subunit S [Eubacterium sp.]|jgi:type I restriction enzyme S subunit|nr:restriction endonuclease subunit S [Eubacterium sp.]